MKAQSDHSKKIIPPIAAGVFIIVAGIIILLNGIPQTKEDTVAVVFKLDAADAHSVSVVGDFNRWDPQANSLHKIDNIWQTEIKLKKGSSYLYNFLIDGEKWIADPMQSHVVKDGFGVKSLLEL